MLGAAACSSRLAVRPLHSEAGDGGRPHLPLPICVSSRAPVRARGLPRTWVGVSRRGLRHPCGGTAGRTKRPLGRQGREGCRERPGPAHQRPAHSRSPSCCFLQGTVTTPSSRVPQSLVSPASGVGEPKARPGHLRDRRSSHVPGPHVGGGQGDSTLHVPTTQC